MLQGITLKPELCSFSAIPKLCFVQILLDTVNLLYLVSIVYTLSVLASLNMSEKVKFTKFAKY